MKDTRLMYQWILAGLLLCLLLGLGGCKEESARTSLNLNLQEKSDTARSLLPKDTPLEVSRYVVEGSGPQDTTFSITSTTANVEIEGLLIGGWELRAVGQNSQGVDLVEGKATCTLSREPTNATIELNSLRGTGKMSVTLTWDRERISNPRLDLWITNAEGTKSAVQPTTNNSANGSVTYSADYPAGSYVIQAQLFSGTVPVAGCVEVVRVVGNITTEGSIPLSLDKYAAIPTSLTLVNKAGVPIECSIQGLHTTLPALQVANPQLVVPNVEAVEDLEVTWYLDGTEIATGFDCSFTPSSGSHRLDVIANGALLASSGSASFTFQAAVTGTSGVPVLVSEVSDTTNGLYVSGNTQVAFLPDGKVLLASSEHQTLQICRLVRDTLEVVRSYGPTSNFNTVGVTDLLVDKITNRVAIADSYNPSLALYQYDSANSSLTKLFVRDEVICERGETKEKTYTALDHLALDASTGYLYALAVGTSYLPISGLYATNQAQFDLQRFSWWMFAQKPHDGLAISPGGTHMAVTNATDGTLRLCTKDVNGYLSANDRLFGTSIRPTPYLGGVKEVAFLNDNHAVAATSNALSRFRNRGLEWEQEEIWVSGENGITAMVGIQHLLTSPAGSFLYVLGSESKNITTFSVNAATGALTHLGSSNLGSFLPSEMALSPDKQSLVIVSDTGNSVLLCRIPQ